MSADNWTYCPRCKNRAGDLCPPKETLREDYEQGIYFPTDKPAAYFVSYRAVCQSCGWSFRFTHEQEPPNAQD